MTSPMFPRRPPRRRTSTGDGAVAGIVAVVVIAVVFALSALSGFALMLLVGALYSEFGWLRPIGFFPAWGISFALGIVLGRFRVSTTNT